MLSSIKRRAFQMLLALRKDRQISRSQKVRLNPRPGSCNGLKGEVSRGAYLA